VTITLNASTGTGVSSDSEDFTDEEMALIADAEVPAECADLEAELHNWQP
jgi:hypothetical protein